MQKYISLFPSPSQSDDQLSTSPTQNDTDAKRDELRSAIRAQMKDGQLPPEPESLVKEDRDKEPKKTRDGNPASTTTNSRGVKEAKAQTRQNSGKKETKAQESMEVDDFFENDDDNDDNDGSEGE